MALIIAFSVFVMFLYMTCWWVISIYLKRNDIADVAWGLGFITLTLALFFRYGINSNKTFLVLGMVIVWGVRLAVHIGNRHRNKPEDGRYVKMKEGWKYKRLQSYVNVFLSQGLFLLLVAMPIMLFFNSKSLTMSWYNYLGILVWLFGFGFEAIGDYQLAEFIKNPLNKGRVMRYGLWKYTRHPNYFGEISLWWGFYIFTLFMPYWYVGIIGPIVITYLIIGVSGIPMLEKRYVGNAEYDDYKKTTSAFFPKI